MSPVRRHPASEQPQPADPASIFQRMGRTTTATLVATVAIGLALVGVIASQGFSAGLSTSTLGSGQILSLNVGPTGNSGDDGVADGLPVASTSAGDADSDAAGAASLAALPPAPGFGPIVLPDDAGTSGTSGSSGRAAPGAGQVADPGPAGETPGPSDPSGPDESPEGPGTDEPTPPTEPPAEPTPTDPGTPVDDGDDGEDPGSIPVDDGEDGEYGEDPTIPEPSVPAEDGEDGEDVGEAGPPGPPAQAPVPESVPPTDPGPPATTPGNGKAKGHSK